jgi:HEPN domain-containing protein
MGTTPPPESDPEVVKQWLRKAHDDLAVAEVVLATTPTARWAACFHGQQAVEKAMKALLVARAVDFPKTHSLGFLGGFSERPVVCSTTGS